ncbi:MAG: SusD/RagB family nutrient-binding outer membrane lipoprotein [Microscillaceae bacterium]|nr:SusD/RagB family nutrient-binding outer membrane lipoprotein [Microscillaceae bacterium]
MKKLKISAWVLAFLMLAPMACDDKFEEVNQNPNFPEVVPAELLMPTIMRNPINDWASLAWNYGNVVMQYTAKIQFTNEDRYNWGPQGSPWNTFYNALRDVKNLIETSEVSGATNYQAIARIMRAWMYHVMTDSYGDVPFTEATQGKEGVNTPAFDPQETVYQGILADLETANSLLNGLNISTQGDILYGGNLLRWQKFANSLRLRILMRLSDRNNPSAAMQAILNDPVNNPIFESNEDQAALTYLADEPNQQPLYTTRSGSFDEFRLSENMEDILKDIDDPRLFVYAQPTNNSGAGVVSANEEDYQGVPNGLGDEEALQYAPNGNPAQGGSNFISRVGLIFACRACNNNASPIGAQTVLMSYAELQFILAEAAERGFITGNAETYYLNGIQASFDYYEERLTVAGSNYDPIRAVIQPGADYFTQPGVAYTGTQAERLAKIGQQKWIALFFNGMEAWFDWRRTGFPTITPGPANLNNDQVPVRFMYPSSVQALNGENYQAVITRQGADNINTRMWWDVD